MGDFNNTPWSDSYNTLTEYSSFYNTAHGFITFEHGADNKTHADLHDLADVTVTFMGLVVDACHIFVSQNNFLKDAA